LKEDAKYQTPTKKVDKSLNQSKVINQIISTRDNFTFSENSALN
jgi:hypothetical protein